MQDVQEKISSLHHKLQQLLKQYAALRKDCERQQQQLAELLNEKEHTAVQLDDLQQQNLILKASLDNLGPEDKRMMEKKLNLYIRNIDKCIAQLSQ